MPGALVQAARRPAEADAEHAGHDEGRAGHEEGLGGVKVEGFDHAVFFIMVSKGMS